MKIFPGDHEVVNSEEVTVNHIPLGFFSEAVKNVKPSIEINKDFCRQSTIRTVHPYQQFDNDQVYLFDENNNIVDNSIYLKRNGNYYFFEPIDSIEFTPDQFDYSILLAREDSFKSNIKYNLKIGCSTEELAEKLIGLVNGESSMKPLNITVNNGSLVPESLLNLSIRETDIMFSNKSDILNVDTYLNNHTNLWLLDDSFDGNLTEDENIQNYQLEGAQIYSSNTFTLDGYSKVKFDINQEIEGFPKSEYEYINLFSNYIPILILKKENKGFVICSHPSILEHIDTCYQLIYEIIMSVYLNSYFETTTRTSYITDDNITYFLSMNQKYNMSHPRISFYKILNEDGFNSSIKYNIANVFISDDNIQCIGLNRYNELLFKKNKKTDPEHNYNSISFYTSNNTVIFFDLQNNLIRTIENNLQINSKIINEKNYIEIAPFKSSSERIDSKASQTIEIPDSAEYILCYDHDLKAFILIHSAIYSEENNGTIYATIRFSYDEELSVGDIRVIGGGEESSNPNYDMIDTGSLKGRPYRLGSTMIIKLPNRFRNYKSQIESEIRKHMASADYPIILFED